MRRRRARRAVWRNGTVGVAMAVVAVFTVAPSGANNFGSIASQASGDTPGSSINLASNSHHTVRFYLIEPAQRSATLHGVNRLDQSLLSFGVLADATCGGSCTQEDVLVVDGNYDDNGYLAWNSCPGDAVVSGGHPERTCYGQIVRYNLFYAYAYDTLQERNRLGCHELAHSVGLRHNEFDTQTISCLNRNVRTSTDLTTT